MGIGDSVLSILMQFLSNRSQHVMVDGCWSKLIDVVTGSGVPQVRVLGPLLFLLYTSEYTFQLFLLYTFQFNLAVKRKI